jgi:hypothetical protein
MVRWIIGNPLVAIAMLRPIFLLAPAAPGDSVAENTDRECKATSGQALKGAISLWANDIEDLPAKQGCRRHGRLIQKRKQGF